MNVEQILKLYERRDRNQQVLDFIIQQKRTPALSRLSFIIHSSFWPVQTQTCWSLTSPDLLAPEKESSPPGFRRLTTTAQWFPSPRAWNWWSRWQKASLVLFSFSSPVSKTSVSTLRLTVASVTPTCPCLAEWSSILPKTSTLEAWWVIWKDFHIQFYSKR